MWGINNAKTPLGQQPPAPGVRRSPTLEEALLFRKLYRDSLVCFSHFQDLPALSLRTIDKV